MSTLATINEEQSLKLAFYAMDRSASDMTAIELINFSFLRGEQHMNLWTAFKRNVSPETLNEIAEREFEDII
jgi:hypothetical protein